MWNRLRRWRADRPAIDVSVASAGAGRGLDFENSQNKKMSALLQGLLERMGVSLAPFGDSTESLTIESPL